MSPLVDTALIFLVLFIVLIILYFTWWLYNNAKQNNDNFDELSDELKKIGKLLLLDDGVDVIDTSTPPEPAPKKKKGYVSLFAFGKNNRQS